MSDKPLVRNPNDKEQVEKAEELEKKREQRRAEAWRHVLSSEQGRLVVQEIIRQCGVFGTAADPSSVNNTFLRLGQQNVGYYLQVQIDLFHPDALWQMKREENKRMEA